VTQSGRYPVRDRDLADAAPLSATRTFASFSSTSPGPFRVSGARVLLAALGDLVQKD